MSILYLISSGLFFLWIIRNTLFWVSLWQLKEYRFDRVKVHLTETMQGRNLLLSPLSLVKWITILLFGVIVFYDNYLPLYELLIAVIWLIQGGIVLREVVLRLVKRPKLTLKASAMVGIILFIIATLYFFPLMDEFLWLLLLDRLVVILSTLFVLIFSIPTEFYRDLKIENAVKKLQALRNDKLRRPIIIGVTGSYGKSSTKDYVAQILEKKFRVVKTKGTNNTPIGIANTILEGLKKSTEVFVVEMGAYKIGEIAEMCDMVKPHVGILTAVNHQHSSLFGGIENTKKAKYELIDSLPKDGIAIFNGNNDNAEKLYTKTKKKKVLYKVVDSKSEKINSQGVYATNIEAEKDSLSFDVVINNKKMRLRAPLIGKHNIENMLPGIYLAHYLGMKEPEIRKAVASLTPIPKTMVRYEVNGISFVDDTFNANPEAVLAAVEYAMVYKKKRILVMQPMIELGKNAREEHYRVAKEVAKLCDYIFVTNTNFYESIEKGVKEGNKKCVLQYGNAAFIHASLGEIARKGDVVIFEGKEAAFVLERFE